MMPRIRLSVGGASETDRPDPGHLVAAWTRLGAGFNVDPAPQTPDLERLILDTARIASTDSRLFAMAMTWLGLYDKLVARHRLAHLTLTELEPGYRPVLGLLLELASTVKPTAHYNAAIAHCDPAELPEPLFDVDRHSAALRARAERRASDISRRWNLWVDPLAPKKDAIRPAAWISEHNPDLRARAEFKGDLRASIIETLRADASAGASETELARACGVTRMAVRAALNDLELAGRIQRVANRNRRGVIIRELAADPAPAN